uniref:Secreted protein n=1 Tax=Caenorhabditis japonica TaxID=281687 RepID=A0A8R1E643_CAEJA
MFFSLLLLLSWCRLLIRGWIRSQAIASVHSYVDSIAIKETVFRISGNQPAFNNKKGSRQFKTPCRNAEAEIPLRKTTILASLDEFRIPMVTPLICFDPDTQFCGWKYTSPWFTLKKPSRQIATTTSVLTPISSSLRRRKSTTARTSTTSRMQSQSTFPNTDVSATRQFEFHSNQQHTL